MTEIFWTEQELEYLNCCPVCGSSNRHLRYPKIEDRICHTQGKWDYYQCRSCSVLYVDPRPLAETIGRAYQDYFTHSVLEDRDRVGWLDKAAFRMRNDYLNWKYGYKNQPALAGGRWLFYFLPPWLRLEWDHNARHLPIPKLGKNRLLDIGCGNGDFIALAQSAGWDCYGVDFDEKSVEIAKSRGLNVSLATTLSAYPASTFDAITLSHVIEHIHCPNSLLNECARLLKTGGVLWMATPNSGSLIRRWFGSDWFDLCAPQHLILFDTRSLKKLVERFSFKAHIELRGVHVQSHWLSSKAIRLGKTEVSDIYISPFVQPKLSIRYWLLELLSLIFPTCQGDIVIRAIRN